MSGMGFNFFNQIKAGIVLVLIFLSATASGCGTLTTWWNYKEYSGCLEKCGENFEADSLRQQCKDRCYSKFDRINLPFSITCLIWITGAQKNEKLTSGGETDGGTTEGNLPSV
jgi:hypothetical protein